MGMGTVDHHHHRVCRLKCWAALLAAVAAVVAVMEAEVIMVAVLHTAVAIHIQAVAAA